jgi:hypothetical protein
MALPEPLRRLFVSLVATLFLLCCGFEVWTGREHWPFSPYPMFSEVEEPVTTVRYRLFAQRAEDPDGPPIPIADPDWIAPFHYIKLHASLGQLAARPASDPSMQQAVQELLERYEQRRLAGDHDGPLLISMSAVALTYSTELNEDFGRPLDIEVLATALSETDASGGPS